MAKFVDINSLTEKVNPDGNEQIQVSATQKLVWKNALMNSGESIGAILSYATQYAMGDTTNRKTIMSMLGQLFYNTGSRADSFFRFVCGSVTIPGGTSKQEYFGIVFYDAHYTRTYAVFFGFENNSVPITFFQRQGNYVIDSPIDDNFVTNIINGKAWTKLGTLDFDALLKQTYGTNTKFLAPVQGSETLLTTTVERILYALGFRGTNTNFRFLTGVNSTSETYWGVAFYNAGQSKTFTVLFGIGGSSLPVGMYQKSGNVTAQKSVDNEFIQDVLSTWTKTWSLNSQGTIYTSDVIAATSDKPITLPGQFAFPSLTDLKTDAFVKQMIYNSGYHESNNCFRQLIASHVIGGTGSQVKCYYGVTWYNSYYGRTYTMLVNVEKTDNEFITIYRKQGKQIENYPSDPEYVEDVIDTWTKSASIGSGGSSPEPITSLEASKVVVSTPTLFTDESGPTVMPSDQNNAQELFQWVLYRLGVRNSPEGIPETCRFAAADGKAAIVFSEPTSSNFTAYVFDSAGSLSVYSLETVYVMEWVANYTSDNDVMMSIVDNGTLLTSVSLPDINTDNLATKSYVRPSDAILTSFPVGTRTILPGENITTSLTSGTLSVQVAATFSPMQKQGPFRDAVIDVPYGVTVNFKDQPGVVYRTDEVDSLVATTGRKVYTIHWIPASTAVSNIPVRAFVNVTNYK